jgi:hypothetical protein
MARYVRASLLSPVKKGDHANPLESSTSQKHKTSVGNTQKCKSDSLKQFTIAKNVEICYI